VNKNWKWKFVSQQHGIDQVGSLGLSFFNDEFEKAFKSFEEQKKSNEQNKADKKLEDALKLLDLKIDSSLNEVKAKYKFLAKNGILMYKKKKKQTLIRINSLI